MSNINYLLAEVFVSPSNSTIIPPFSSKVGKTLLGGRHNVSVSPLKRGHDYLVKYSALPHYLEVEAGELFSFEVGGSEGDVIDALSNLEEREVFNTRWEVVDVKIRPVEFDCRSFDVIIRTPALIPDPFRKDRRKRFTNLFAFTFALNIMDHLGINREEYRGIMLEIEEKVREEPSRLGYATVIYAGKEVVGLVGTLRYTVLEDDERIRGALENAIAKGIGSSRRNGFGRVEVVCNGLQVPGL